jgi:hypothetical protein
MKRIIALSLATALAAGVTAASPGANAATVGHYAWCEQHFRSYNPATDSYTGYDGYAHRCISPYAAGNTVTFGAVRPFVATPGAGFNRNPSPYGYVPNYANQSNPNGPGSGTTYRVFPGDDTNASQ